MSELKEGEVGETILSWTRARDVPSEVLRYEIFWPDSFSQQFEFLICKIFGRFFVELF